MPIAWSGKPQIKRYLRSDSSANLRADLDSAVRSVGWVPTAISGGYKYAFASPQTLSAKCKIWDAGAVVGVARYPAISVQFMSADESKVGMEHHLVYGPFALPGTPAYQVIVGCCQIFVSLPGNTGTPSATVAGGVPRVPLGTSIECTVEKTSAAITTIWWSSAGGDAAFSADENTRWSSGPQLWDWVSYSYCVNNLLVATGTSGQHGDSDQSGALQIYAFTPTNQIDLSISTAPKTEKWTVHTPLYIDAFIGWQFQIWGQIWDAMLCTDDQPLDSLLVTTEPDVGGGTVPVTWQAWNSIRFSTLYLRISPVGGPAMGNVAY